MSVLNASAFSFQISAQHLPLSSYIRACTRVRFSMCVFSAGWGSICVRLTRWEPLPAGSPGGSKSYGRPEAQNPSRPGQMSLCSAAAQNSATSQTFKTVEAESGSQKRTVITSRSTITARTICFKNFLNSELLSLFIV